MKEDSIRLEIVYQNEVDFNPNNYFSYFSNSNLDKQLKLTKDIKLSTLTTIQKGLKNNNQYDDIEENYIKETQSIERHCNRNNKEISNKKLKDTKEDVVNYLDDYSKSKTSIQNYEEKENNHEIYKQLDSSFSKTLKNTTNQRKKEEIKVQVDSIDPIKLDPNTIKIPKLRENEIMIQGTNNPVDNAKKYDINIPTNNSKKESQSQKVSSAKCHCILF
jgi:hypothetical protein